MTKPIVAVGRAHAARAGPAPDRRAGRHLPAAALEDAGRGAEAGDGGARPRHAWRQRAGHHPGPDAAHRRDSSTAAAAPRRCTSPTACRARRERGMTGTGVRRRAGLAAAAATSRGRPGTTAFGLDVLGLASRTWRGSRSASILQAHVQSARHEGHRLHGAAGEGDALREGACQRSRYRQAAVLSRPDASRGSSSAAAAAPLDRGRLHPLRADAARRRHARRQARAVAQDGRVHAVEPARARQREPHRQRRPTTRRLRASASASRCARMPGIVRMVGRPASFLWNGAHGTIFWVDPKEQLAVVFMAQTPGPSAGTTAKWSTRSWSRRS